MRLWFVRDSLWVFVCGVVCLLFWSVVVYSLVVWLRFRVFSWFSGGYLLFGCTLSFCVTVGLGFCYYAFGWLLVGVGALVGICDLGFVVYLIVL